MARRKSVIGRKLRNTTDKANIRNHAKKTAILDHMPEEQFSSIRIVRHVQERIVRGTFHQGDVKFANFSRGRQCTANAAMAIAMCQVIELSDWTPSTIDTVLLHGDKLYADSVSKRMVPHGAEINREFLRVTELSQYVELCDIRLNLIVNEGLCIDGNLIHNMVGFPNLRNGLDSFLNEYPCGILTTKGISVAVFRSGCYFWLFDSHARGPYGRQSFQDGAACLMRFNDIKSLYDVLACNLFLGSSNDVLSQFQYTLTPIYFMHSVPSVPIKGKEIRCNVEIENDEDNVYAHPKQQITDGRDCSKNTGVANNKLTKQSVEVPEVQLGIETSAEVLLNKYERDFRVSIWKFADITCTACKRLFYKPQTCKLVTNDIVQSVLPSELKHQVTLTVCNRCATKIKSGKCPAQAYWNAMFLDPIPEVIASLTDIEKRLISRVVPFIKIIKFGGRFGQYGFKGQAVLFAADVEEVIEQLPVSITSAGVAIVCEKLESVTRSREFQVDVERLWSALLWLKENNALYRNVQIDYSNTIFDLTQICQMVGDVTETDNNLPQETRPQTSGTMKNIKNDRGILRGSFHQGDEHFSEANRANQGTANAALAIVMSYNVCPTSWTKDTIDTILINGDRLYTKSVETRNVPPTAEINREYLTVTDLHKNLTLLGRIYNLIIDDAESVFGQLERDNALTGFPNLSNGLDSFLINHSAGILIANDVSVAIFKMSGYFWLFDPHPRGPNGRKAGDKGTACLVRFEHLQSLLKLLKCNLPKRTVKLYSNQYSLTPLRVTDPLDNGLSRTSVHSHVNAKIMTQPYVQPSTNTFSGSNIIEYNQPMMTSVLRPTDESIPQVDSVIHGCSTNNGEPINNVPLRTLQRKTAPPLQMHVEKRAEELAWFHLFPNGRNGLHEPTRSIPITPLDYCQSRIMSADKRFQRNDYLFYSLSVMEYYRVRQNVGVCLRLRQGDTRPEGLENNLYLNMRGLRGSNAYWQTACSDLIATVRNLGPPSWFVTFSCNDLNWPDMLKACLIAAGRDGENPEDLQWDDKMKLIEESPVTLARQFMVRLHAIIRVLKQDSEILGGKLVDYWWRKEFQNRGSPHVHMLCWNEGIPSFESCAGVAVIDKVVSCASKPRNGELAAIVQRVQIHHHSPTCYKNRSDNQCRFSFPRQASECTKILDPDGIIRNKGRFCILKRDPADVFVNNYNPTLLKLWSGNMDIQPCGNVIAIAYYIAKYASKHEPQDVGQAVRDAVTRVQRYGGDIGRQLYAVSMALLRFRQVSAPECAFRLCHLKLRDSSRKVVFVNTCRPEERYRMLRCDSNEGQVHINIFDRYMARPDNLEEISLAEFSVTYEHTTNLDQYEDLGDHEAYDTGEIGTTIKTILLKNGMRMKQRSRKAILKTRCYTQTGDREGYFYSYLVAHVPFRSEEELIRNCYVPRLSGFWICYIWQFSSNIKGGELRS